MTDSENDVALFNCLQADIPDPSTMTKKATLTLASLATAIVSLQAAPQYSCDLTFTGYSGSATLTNFPALVRLADASPAGFTYRQLRADGADAGVCSFDLTKRDERGGAELHKLYTLPAYWGRGLGRLALDEICRRCREAGATSVWLRVNKGNARAQKAYRAAGFANVRAVCTDIGGGFVMDDFVFVRPLS